MSADIRVVIGEDRWEFMAPAGCRMDRGLQSTAVQQNGDAEYLPIVEVTKENMDYLFPEDTRGTRLWKGGCPDKNLTNLRNAMKKALDDGVEVWASSL